jgi:DNA-binding transcriptional LysR family regulator
VLPPPDTLAGVLIAELFQKQGLSLPTAPVRTLSLHLTANLLATNQYVATLPLSLLRFDIAGHEFKRLNVNLPAQDRAVAVVGVKSRTPNPIARLFIECAHTVARPLERKTTMT